MTQVQLEAYRNEIIRQRNYLRRTPDWLPWEDAIEGARAHLGMCYIARAEARAAGKPELYVRRFIGVPRPPVRARPRTGTP